MTYTRVKVESHNGPELQKLATAVFKRDKKVPFCLESSPDGNTKLAHAYSNHRYAFLLYEGSKLVGMLYGNPFREGGFECIELSVISAEEIDASAIIEDYAKTLPATVKVYK